jgi:hypothetical protein
MATAIVEPVLIDRAFPCGNRTAVIYNVYSRRLLVSMHGRPFFAGLHRVLFGGCGVCRRARAMCLCHDTESPPSPSFLFFMPAAFVYIVQCRQLSAAAKEAEGGRGAYQTACLQRQQQRKSTSAGGGGGGARALLSQHSTAATAAAAGSGAGGSGHYSSATLTENQITRLPKQPHSRSDGGCTYARTAHEAPAQPPTRFCFIMNELITRLKR